MWRDLMVVLILVIIGVVGWMDGSLFSFLWLNVLRVVVGTESTLNLGP